MTPSDFEVRRATIDDLGILQKLWVSMQISPIELESKLTEFQIAISPEGAVVGAVGIEILERQGRIHSEVFLDFSQADGLRELFWERLSSIAKSHGLSRIWTTETARFWKTNGLNPAKPDELRKLPAAWVALKGDWITLQLRDEEALEAAMARAVNEFKSESAMKRKDAEKPLRTLNILATVFSIIFALALVLAAVYMMRHRSIFSHR